jgi:SAM-dependent methyltransferase
VKGEEWYQADEIAEAYEDKRFSGGGRLVNDREMDAVIDALGPLADTSILEIACGTGRFSVAMAERGADVTGIDISGPMLTQGRASARNAGVADQIEFLRGDAARLPFPDDSFDAVLAMRFFHLADRPEAFLAEMERVSRDRVVFDTFRRYSTRSLYTWLLPMGSRLHSRRDVEALVATTDLDLQGAAHDFVLPYGLYREIPELLARPLRTVDAGVGALTGEALASVSFWTATHSSGE